jgi:hypothetical protein
MNVISNAIAGLASQYAGRYADNLQTTGASGATQDAGAGTFLSMLQLLDVNGDNGLDMNELKLGLEGFITNLVLKRDLNGDQVLNAEESGAPAEAIAGLDSNGDQGVDGEELLSEAGRILDGIVPLLDKNNDQVLSMNELAILELFFGTLNQTNASADSIFTHSSSAAGESVELDLNTIPQRMREAGFEGSDNALYYSLAHVYHYGPGAEMPDDGAGSLAVLNTQREAIYNWFEGEMTKVENMLKTNPQATVTAITNDGKDRCGFRLGAAIVERLKSYGNRVALGDILPESEYGSA